MSIRQPTLALAVGAACVNFHGGASAQTAPPTAATELPATTVGDTAGDSQYVAPSASVGVLGDLQVIDAPYSINVLTSDLLDNQQAQSYGDYLKNDPSSVSGNVPVGFSTLRGFNVGTGGYLFDGLPGALPLGDGRYQLIGVDRIEILKGPSAFLYGLGASTSLGGTINFVPKRPEDGPIRTFTTGVTSRSLFSASADIGDRFGADRQFGYRLNIGAKGGEQAPKGADWRQQAMTLALDWRVNSNLLFSGGIEYARNAFPQLQPFFGLAPGLQVPQAPSARRSLAQSWDDFRTVGTNAYLRADWQFAPDWSLSAQALHSSNHRPNTKEARFGFIGAQDGSAVLFGSEDGGFKQEGDTLQVAVRGKLTTGSLSHSLTVATTGSRTEGRAGTSASLGDYPTNIYRPTDSPEPADQSPSPLLRTQTTSTSSLLLSDIIKFNDQWSVLLGARHARLELNDYDRIGGFVENTSKLSKTTPTVAAMFKPTGSSLLYATYSQGIEAGGKAPTGTVNEDQQLPPIVTKQVELGAKLEAGGVLWTAALFDMRRPLEYVDTTTRTYVQKGLQRHKGLELTAKGKLTNDLSLVTGLMWLDPRTSNTGDKATEGKRPVGVPRLVANLFAEYRVAPGFYVSGGIYHANAQYLDGANTQKMPGWTRFDAGLRYETRLGTVPAAFLFNVENLANKKYWASAQSSILTLADPRTFKLSARFNF